MIDLRWDEIFILSSFNFDSESNFMSERSSAARVSVYRR